MMKRLIESDGGVSDTLGYIIIIGIVVTAIGITYMLGYPMLQNMISSGHVQNMERGFIILGNNVDRVMEQSTPMQNTELSMRGGTLMVVKYGKFTISYTNTSGTFEDSWDLYTIKYDYPGSRIIGYEFGATMEKYGAGNTIQGGTVLKKPKMVVGDPFIIPIVNLYGSGIDKAGSGLAEVLIYGGETNIIRHDDVDYVDLTVESDFYLAWEEYFKEIGLTDVHHDDALHTAYAKYSPSEDITLIEVNKPISLEIE
jgi:hypothetical protein